LDLRERLKCEISGFLLFIGHQGAKSVPFFYHDEQQREKMVAAERINVDEKVHKIIELKKQVSYHP
jgi:hypothetical protein